MAAITGAFRRCNSCRVYFVFEPQRARIPRLPWNVAGISWRHSIVVVRHLLRADVLCPSRHKTLSCCVIGKFSKRVDRCHGMPVGAAIGTVCPTRPLFCFGVAHSEQVFFFFSLPFAHATFAYCDAMEKGKTEPNGEFHWKHRSSESRPLECVRTARVTMEEKCTT